MRNTKPALDYHGITCYACRLNCCLVAEKLIPQTQKRKNEKNIIIIIAINIANIPIGIIVLFFVYPYGLNFKF